MSLKNASPTSAGKAIHWLEGQIVYSMGFGVIVLLLTGAGLAYFAVVRPPSTQIIRIGYGTGGAVRKYFLEQLAIQGKKQNLDLRLVPTEGTDETLSVIDQNGADLGLIAGAIEDRESRRVLEITPLYMEPLQLLVREELYEPVLKDFGRLRGTSIAMDGQNTATSLLAAELLRFIGLTDPATGQPRYQRVDLPQSQLLSRRGDSSLPDAIFQIAGVPSPVVRSLIVDNGYRLVPLPFGSSFNLDKFRDTEAPDPFAGATLRLDKSFVEEAVIPAFVYGVLPSVPPSDTRTIATRLLLVGSDRLDDQTVRRVLELILSPEVRSLTQPALTVDLLNSSYQFDRHPGTDYYLSSLKPFNIDGVFQAYSRIGELWGIIIALYFASAKGLKMWQERKAQTTTKSVGDFLGEVLAVEVAVHASSTAEDRIALDQRLSDIKKTAIELQLAGQLEDAETFHSLLVTLSDTRTRIWGSASSTRYD